MQAAGPEAEEAVEDNSPAGSGTDAAAQEPVAEPARTPVLAETPVAAAPVVEEDDGRPKRSGWWSRRFL